MTLLFELFEVRHHYDDARAVDNFAVRIIDDVRVIIWISGRDHDDDVRFIDYFAARFSIGNFGDAIQSFHRYSGRVRKVDDRELASVLGG